MLNFVVYLILKMRGGDNMNEALVDGYIALIIAKRRTIDTILPQFKVRVLADLNAIGLDGYGNALPVVPEVTV